MQDSPPPGFAELSEQIEKLLGELEELRGVRNVADEWNQMYHQLLQQHQELQQEHDQALEELRAMRQNVAQIIESLGDDNGTKP
ncbi:MAG: hypothetical protein ISN29_12190 [Gammaproteobacteria bacterium AqS3]|nr:hypothetical protein [Gammaproteobacteria bacterium AqS3]